MLIEMYVKKETTDTEGIPELCEFKGIRFNSFGLAMFETNHSRHDYIMPLEKEDYLKLEKELKKAYLSKARLIELSGDVFRVRRDNFTLTKCKASNWAVKIVEPEEPEVGYRRNRWN